MQDVARAARVHQTTVSRALRNDSRIPEATRLRVVRAAMRLRYRPNPLVSALIALRRARHPAKTPTTLAFVIHTYGMRRHYLPHQYNHLAHLSGARAAAEEQGYQIESFSFNLPEMTERRFDEILYTRNIPGVIIGSLPEGPGSFDLNWDRICTVAIEYTFTHPLVDRVVHDSYGGMRMIMHACRERNIRRIGLLLTEGGNLRTERLNAAAYWIEQKSGNDFVPIPPLFFPSWDSGAFAAWHDRHRPEVVVTSNTLLPDLTGWCGRTGVKLGRDLLIINVNADPRAPLPGVFQNPHSIGAAAARLVIDKISRNDRGIPRLRVTQITQGEWVQGRGNMTLKARQAGLQTPASPKPSPHASPPQA
jgi:LacI family transcriptional regulator/LacI family fructose operon transcriptional repressor